MSSLGGTRPPLMEIKHQIKSCYAPGLFSCFVTGLFEQWLEYGLAGRVNPYGLCFDFDFAFQVFYCFTGY